jgi:hypothetical protein
MEPDIKKRILKDFGAKAPEAVKLIEALEERLKLSPRISRCVIHLANGDIADLKKRIRHAEEDWRDVILWAESFDFELKKPFKTE